MTFINTANVQIYHLQKSERTNELITHLEENKYKKLEFKDTITKPQSVVITAFAKENSGKPDWARLISPYIQPASPFEGFIKFDLVVLIECVSKAGNKHTFTFFSGLGYPDVYKYLDYTFGISILERIFNPEVNKLKSVLDKGILGDVLADKRSYRRSRPLAYEEDFAKYYQDINIRVTERQFREAFPLFVGQRRKKLKPLMSISGAVGVNIKMMTNFVEVICFVKDLANLVDVVKPRIFNTSLIPLDNRRDKDLISELNVQLVNNFADYCLSPDKHSMDFDFCHSDVELFLSSATCTISAEGFTDNKGESIQIEIEDIYEANDPIYVCDLIKEIQKSTEYKRAEDKTGFISNALQCMKVVTNDENGQETTNGKFFDYVQQEITYSGTPYFILDNTWYLIQNQFDSSLAKRYQVVIGKQFQDYGFIKKWNKLDEKAYNKLYDNQPNSFYLHEIKVDHVELCDALIEVDPIVRTTRGLN
jgi:hypothetical protein